MFYLVQSNRMSFAAHASDCIDVKLHVVVQILKSTAFIHSEHDNFQGPYMNLSTSPFSLGMLTTGQLIVQSISASLRKAFEVIIHCC